MVNIFAQVLGTLGIGTNVIGIQLKQKQHILIAFMAANLLFGSSFILLKGYSGAVICLVAAVQTLINYQYERKNKEFPKYLIVSYIIIAFICGIFTYKTLIDILPVICSVLYTLSIIQKRESNLRKVTFINIILWVIYDYSVGAYAAFTSDLFLTVSTIVAIIRYDILKKNKTNIN